MFMFTSFVPFTVETNDHFYVWSPVSSRCWSVPKETGPFANIDDLSDLESILTEEIYESVGDEMIATYKSTLSFLERHRDFFFANPAPSVAHTLVAPKVKKMPVTPKMPLLDLLTSGIRSIAF